MSTARKAVDSTLRRILIYTAEIIMSIILLVVICIPLAFGLPIWFQTVVFGAARSELVVNPVVWFGAGGAFWVTLLLSLVSIFIGYVYVYRLVPSTDSDEEDEEEEEEEAEPSELEAEEDEEDAEKEDEVEEPEEEVVAENQA
ncbi:MAG: hypothetical protein ACXABV_19280 [Candidatus Thorarchaeota archaeon]|jgi:membrane protein implicated in regulation of membrane protease activity